MDQEVGEIMRKKSYGFWVFIGIFLLVQPYSLALAQDVEMKVSGEIHRGVLFYDTGNNGDTRNVDNDNDPSLFRFEGLLKKGGFLLQHTTHSSTLSVVGRYEFTI